MGKWEDFSKADQQFLIDLYKGDWKPDMRKARKSALKGLLTIKVSEWISQRPEVLLTNEGKLLVRENTVPAQSAPADAADLLPAPDLSPKALATEGGEMIFQPSITGRFVL